MFIFCVDGVSSVETPVNLCILCSALPPFGCSLVLGLSRAVCGYQRYNEAVEKLHETVHGGGARGDRDDASGAARDAESKAGDTGDAEIDPLLELRRQMADARAARENQEVKI